MTKARTLYSSSNGDCWSLIRDPAGGVLIRHEANAASGGHVETVEIAAFLGRGRGPEQQELLRLIGTLVEAGREAAAEEGRAGGDRTGRVSGQEAPAAAAQGEGDGDRTGGAQGRDDAQP